MVAQALANGKIILPGLEGEITHLKGEQTYHTSRFDFYFETKDQKGFIEVKGVTLEEDGVVLFPDAPTERGLKHIYELIQAKGDGYLAYIIFVIQMKDVAYFAPNVKMHKAFGHGLVQAQDEGVEILAYDSLVSKESIAINKPVLCKI